MKPYELLRICGPEHKDGKQFLEWGPMWSYHFDEHGHWIKAQINGRGCHGGYDIVCPSGTVIRAPGDGKVVLSGWQDATDQKRGFGLRIVIELKEPFETKDGLLLKPWVTIAHLSEKWVPAGALVSRGFDIGLSGNSGNSSGAHCHVQLEKPGDHPRTPLPLQWVNS